MSLDQPQNHQLAQTPPSSDKENLSPTNSRRSWQDNLRLRLEPLLGKGAKCGGISTTYAMLQEAQADLKNKCSEVIFLRGKTQNWQALYTESQEKIKNLEAQLQSSNCMISQQRQRIIKLEQILQLQDKGDVSLPANKIKPAEENKDAVGWSQKDIKNTSKFSSIELNIDMQAIQAEKVKVRPELIEACDLSNQFAP